MAQFNHLKKCIPGTLFDSTPLDLPVPLPTHAIGNGAVLLDLDEDIPPVHPIPPAVAPPPPPLPPRYPSRTHRPPTRLLISKDWDSLFYGGGGCSVMDLVMCYCYYYYWTIIIILHIVVCMLSRSVYHESLSFSLFVSLSL